MAIARDVWMAWPVEKQVELLQYCAAKVRVGQPREFAETFLQVENKLKGVGVGTSALVPLRFTGPQERYYAVCFGERVDAWEPLYQVGDKARQVYLSTFDLAMEFSQYFCTPGWNMAVFAHRDDAAKTLGHYVDVFWESVPVHLRPVVKYWREDYKELDFGGGVTNRIDFFSAQSNTVPRSYRYQAVHYSEGAHYPEKYWLEVSAAITPMQPVWELWETTRYGITYQETGNPNQHYVKVQAAKKGGGRRTAFVQCFWYQDAANRLAVGDARAIEEAAGRLALTEEERALALKFPQDGVPAEDRIRWRRTEIYKYVEQHGGNKKRGKAIFLQENLEDDASGWANADKTPFDVDLCTRYLHVEDALIHDQPTEDGMLVQLSQEPIPGRDYAAGMDSAAGRKGGDKTSVSLVDAGDGNTRYHVGRLIGDVGALPATRHIKPLLERYHMAYFAIERTGGYGANAVQALQDASYPRLYKRTRNRTEDMTKYLLDVDDGFDTTQASKARVIQQLIDDFNGGRFKTYFKDTLHMFMNYDPTAQSHTPDELISLALANEAARDQRVWTQREEEEEPFEEKMTRRERRKMKFFASPNSDAHVWR